MAWYYFAFGKNNVNCFEKYSFTSDIITATEKLILTTLDKKTVLTTVAFNHLLQVKNYLYVFDLTNDNDIVIIFPETDSCSKVFNILNKKMVQTDVDPNDLFKARFLKPFCRRYLGSSSNEFKSLRDEIISAFDGLKEEDFFLNMLLEQNQEHSNVTETVQSRASECIEIITISDDEDNAPNSKSSYEVYTIFDDDDDSNTDSEINKKIYCLSNNQDEIIRAPFFKHNTTQLGCLGLKIYSPIDQSLFYQLTYDPYNNYYRCYRCKSLGKYVSAIVERDEDCNEIVVLRGGPHICEEEINVFNDFDDEAPKSVENNVEKAWFGEDSRSVEVPLLEKENLSSQTTRKRKHSSSTSEGKIIRPPMYKRAVTEDGNPKLLVLDSNDIHISYEYLYDRICGHYYCSECNKLNTLNSAKLHYDSNFEEYLLLQSDTHVCVPQLNLDTSDIMSQPRNLLEI